MDDYSFLLHADYDPAARRERYLRTRQLKGRAKGTGRAPGNRSLRSPAAKPHTKSNYAEEVAALKKRLARLKEVLSELVQDAKSRAGVETKSTSSKATASKSKGGSSSLTPTERKKAAKASAEYRKKHPEKKTPKEEVEALQKQIADIRAKIRKATEDARHPAGNPATKTASKGR